MTVTVFVDGKPVAVPDRVGSWRAVREALGVSRGLAIGVACAEGWALLGTSDEDRPGENVRCWDFTDGDAYKTFGFDEAASFGLLPDAEDDPADWWKRAT